jgi:hypothetical protein
MKSIVVLGACHAVHIARCINSCDEVSATPICLHLIDKTHDYPLILIESDIVVTIEAQHSGRYSLASLKDCFPTKVFIVYPYLHSPSAFPFLINAQYTWNDWFGPRPTACRLRVAHRLIEYWEETQNWQKAFELTHNALLNDEPEKWTWLWPCRTNHCKINDCPITTKLLEDAPSAPERIMLTDNHPNDIVYHTVCTEILDFLQLTPSKNFPCDLQTGDVIYPRYPFNQSNRVQTWVSQNLYITLCFTQRAVDGIMESFTSGDYKDKPWYTAAVKFNEKFFDGKKDVLYIAKRLASGATEGEIP